ncbi:MAG: tetratricopeptide repeat protein [Deltaproteobacteria bacterium]|nr:tetratricopeptide repeat protein [Deltaproteobacteria bacterium]
MEAHSVTRKLAAIFHADVQGYSRLIGKDEVTTLRTVASYLEMMRTLVGQHGGRAIGSRGDSLLAEFPSVVEAVQGAVEMQQELRVRNAEMPVAQRVEFRIGINLGEVVVEGNEIYGDGVNIAVRLESMAEAGGICISAMVHDQVRNRLALRYEDLGEQTLKNIERPIRVWRVRVEESESPKSQVPSPTLRRVGSAHLRWVVAGLALVAGIIVTVRYVSLLTPSTQHPTPSTHPTLSTQDSTHSTAAVPAALPLPAKPSLVVLPFVNMSEDPVQAYFSDGLTEVLTGDLSKISSLFVIARNSAFTYKGKAVKVQDVGREMGVRYVLEGSVQKADQQVRIAAQLIDATTGYHLWSEQYDRPLKDIFKLQDEIVQRIVTTLRLQLTVEEQGIIVRKTTDNLEAYDAFLRGVAYCWLYTKEANVQARQMFEKAIELDSHYAEAYVGLGRTYYLEWILRWSTDPQTLERELALVRHAVALDDSLPAAHVSLSWIYTQQLQFDQAIAESERAVALDPNNADSYAAQAEVLQLAGRSEEALRAIEKAMRLDPRYPPWYLFELGVASRLTGRFAEAIAALQEAVRRSPNFTYAYLNLGLSYVLQWVSQQSPAAQTLEPAVAAAQRALALSDSLHWSHILLGFIYLTQQQYDQALAEMERAVALAPTEAASSAGLALVLSTVGRSDEALAAAAQALRLKTESGTVDEYFASVGEAYNLAGRPEEAIGPFKRYLTRYPNILGPHLTLAAVYSELGREVEARAEAAEVLRINSQFSLEVLRQRAPIKDPAMLERYLAALRKAGLK